MLQFKSRRRRQCFVRQPKLFSRWEQRIHRHPTPPPPPHAPPLPDPSTTNISKVFSFFFRTLVASGLMPCGDVLVIRLDHTIRVSGNQTPHHEGFNSSSVFFVLSQNTWMYSIVMHLSYILHLGWFLSCPVCITICIILHAMSMNQWNVKEQLNNWTWSWSNFIANLIVWVE